MSKKRRRWKPDPLNVERALENLKRVNQKHEPLFRNFGKEDRAALSWYYLRHESAKDILNPERPRRCQLYCPLADQRKFPSGHRYCINVYTGCGHACEYCYAQAYRPQTAKCKAKFTTDLAMDLAELDDYSLPPAPLHLANSTDPFQPIELQLRHSLVALQGIAANRKHFTSVVILTRNPQQLLDPEYLELVHELSRLSSDHPFHNRMAESGSPAVRVEVSVPFWQDKIRQIVEPCAPTIQSRLDAIRKLRSNGIPVILRIDPLFPQNPVCGKSLLDYGLPEFQCRDDLERLVDFAAEVGVMHVVYSALKIVTPKDENKKPVQDSELPPITTALISVFEHLSAPACGKRNRTWRLPPQIAKETILEPFLAICHQHDVKAFHCMENLLKTP